MFYLTSRLAINGIIMVIYKLRNDVLGNTDLAYNPVVSLARTKN
jgi:hypothetical protein